MEKLLIEKVRKRDFLYDSKCVDYRDKRMRNKAWEEIGIELEITPENAKDAWERLRRCYINALHRRRHKNCVDGAKKLHPWKYEQNMSFLLPLMDIKHTQENKLLEEFSYDPQTSSSAHDDVIVFKNEILSNENSFEPFDENESCDTQSETNLHNTIANEYPNNIKKRCEEEDGLTNLLSTRNFDETDMLFLSLAKTTKLLPPIEQAKVKLQVSQTVLQAQIAFYEQAKCHS